MTEQNKERDAFMTYEFAEKFKAELPRLIREAEIKGEDSITLAIKEDGELYLPA